MRGYLEYKTQLFKKGKEDAAPTGREAAVRLLPLRVGELQKGRERNNHGNSAKKTSKSPTFVRLCCPCPARCLWLGTSSRHRWTGVQSPSHKGRPQAPRTRGSQTGTEPKGLLGAGSQAAAGRRAAAWCSVLSRYPMGARRVLAGRGQLRWPWAGRTPSAGEGNGGGQRRGAPQQRAPRCWARQCSELPLPVLSMDPRPVSRRRPSAQASRRRRLHPHGPGRAGGPDGARRPGRQGAGSPETPPARAPGYLWRPGITWAGGR